LSGLILNDKKRRIQYFTCLGVILAVLLTLYSQLMSQIVQEAKQAQEPYFIEKGDSSAIQIEDSVFVLTDEILREEMDYGPKTEFAVKAVVSSASLILGASIFNSNLIQNEYCFSYTYAGCILSPIIINNTIKADCREKAKKRILEQHKGYKIIDESSEFYIWDQLIFKVGTLVSGKK